MKEMRYFDISMRSLSAVFAHNNMTTEQYQDMIKHCYQWNGSSRNECIIGFVSGLIEFGPPTKEYTLGLDFCGTKGFDSDGRYQCYKGMMEISGTYYDALKTASICSMIPKDIDVKTLKYCSTDSDQKAAASEYVPPQL